jgi:hypothetical protein
MSSNGHAGNFLALFRSSPESVTFRLAVTGTDDKGKREGQYVTKRRPMTLADVESHFEGKTCLVGKPALLADVCTWGAIDIDVYDLDEAKAIAEDVKTLGLPLVCFKSKSNGVHLFIFFREPVPCAACRHLLSEYAEQLGYPGAEINPKAVQPGKLAYGIALPFFGTVSGFAKFAPIYAPNIEGFRGPITTAPGTTAPSTPAPAPKIPVGKRHATQKFQAKKMRDAGLSL